MNRSTRKEQKSESISKIDYFGASSLIARQPDLKELSYIARHWDMVGQVSSSGFGVQSLQCGEVESYGRLHKVGDWELAIIHQMSLMFIKAKRMFDDVLCECPYRYEDKPMLELQLLASRPIIENKKAS